MRSRWFFAVPLLLLAATAWAETRGPVPEIRPMLGAYVPVGDQRDVLDSSMLVGVQGGVEIAQRIHLLGTFAWSMSQDPRLLVNHGVNLYQYDAGLEVFHSLAMGSSWMIRPFAGAGVGGRTFDYSDVDAGAQTAVTGYGALGTEVQTGRFAVRLEARDYVYRFEGLDGTEDATTRNDLTLVVGAALHMW